MLAEVIDPRRYAEWPQDAGRRRGAAAIARRFGPSRAPAFRHGWNGACYLLDPSIRESRSHPTAFN